ncbi:MAG: hypothetical protein EAZ14_11330 [Runella slithyformis]|nr:MAG: hypothetical protein EAZ80_08630 [Runella slithyformis]TAG17835.1 MAG: hypothetical protein EAZ38_16475 [Cytophagales bacterium]TAG37556.1 MAG: hypothetical protein EAZ32_15005 [Cytophagia bacterium]TAF78458.1 MAG: hypothetical protein EAZ50_13845 [Runella slithyformis]TAG74721.1 MAG: hypothetical protein EAZ26_01790 [Runella slithyformis]
MALFLFKMLNPTAMKPFSTRSHSPISKSRFVFDETILLAGLTLLIFGYIILYFLYPLFSKGLLF